MYCMYGLDIYIQQTNFLFHHKENKTNQNNIIIDHYLIFIRLEMWKREFSHNNIVNETIFSEWEWETFLYIYYIQKKLMEWTNQRKNRIKSPKQQSLRICTFSTTRKKDIKCSGLKVFHIFSQDDPFVILFYFVQVLRQMEKKNRTKYP